MEIAVFTSIRSEYGLLTPLIREINNTPEFNLKLLVGGAHLKKEFGETINQIRKDGFIITQEFDFLSNDLTDGSVSQSLGKLYTQIGDYFSKSKIDLLVILGDRFELLPVATVALINNIAIAHISGGETTEGAIDNQVRHALTKLSHLHFPATDTYAKNIEKMGEEKWRICASGEPGLDEILSINYLDKKTLFKELGLDINIKTICCTFHPQTIDNKLNANKVVNILFEILTNTEMQILATAANFDKGGYEINIALEKLSHENHRFKYVKSLGQQRYYSLLKYADLVLGNSSSGLVEAQSFNVPVINVGDRQKGRLANENVINVGIDIPRILDAVKFSQTTEFRNKYYGKPNIYGDGNSCKKITEFIKKMSKKKIFIKKDNFA